MNGAVEPSGRLASHRHTAVLLAILVAIAAGGLLSGGRVDSAAPANPLPTYAVLAAGQILLVRYVRAGLRRKDRSLASEAGLQNVAVRSWLVDAAVAAVFIAVSRLLILGFRQIVGPYDSHTSFLMPHTLLEKSAWVLLSVVAGVCEELTFRTYLQRQFGAIFRSPLPGVLAQAVIFGVTHGYQGWKPMLTISFFGILFGLLAWWRGNVRAAILAHTAVDIFGGLFPS
ncbi:MAG: type II CAAX endopeptidase family protein [Acidobacteriota bacterium]